MMSTATHALVVLAGALALDVVVGEPPNALHPVVWMGRFYRALRRRAPRSPAAAFAWGAAMAAAGPLVFGGAAYALARATAPLPWLQLAVEIWLLKSAFAIRALAIPPGTNTAPTGNPPGPRRFRQRRRVSALPPSA